ncbi:MAG: ParB N-terminal domain-containing protein [Vulcanisaeta sp.]|nr:ParB N-terminal domain-containing protein [Vulcanisaeta sp.]
MSREASPLRIETRSPSSLKPLYEYKIPEEYIFDLVKSLLAVKEMFAKQSQGGAPPILQPIVVSADNYIIDGFKRVQAAIDLGWQEIPAIVAPIKCRENERTWNMCMGLRAALNDNRWAFAETKDKARVIRRNIVLFFAREFIRNLNEEAKEELRRGLDVLANNKKLDDMPEAKELVGKLIAYVLAHTGIGPVTIRNDLLTIYRITDLREALFGEKEVDPLLLSIPASVAEEMHMKLPEDKKKELVDLVKQGKIEVKDLSAIVSTYAKMVQPPPQPVVAPEPQKEVQKRQEVMTKPAIVVAPKSQEVVVSPQPPSPQVQSPTMPRPSTPAPSLPPSAQHVSQPTATPTPPKPQQPPPPMREPTIEEVVEQASAEKVSVTVSRMMLRDAWKANEELYNKIRSGAVSVRNVFILQPLRPVPENYLLLLWRFHQFLTYLSSNEKVVNALIDAFTNVPLPASTVDAVPALLKYLCNAVGNLTKIDPEIDRLYGNELRVICGESPTSVLSRVLSIYNVKGR